MTATDKWSTLHSGGVAAGVFISLRANGVIPMWSPVILVAPDTGTRLPEVGTTTTANDNRVIGIAVGGNSDFLNTGDACGAAGDICQVQIYGLTKCVVDGGAANIAIGDMLITQSTAGQARQITANAATYDATFRYTFAKAMFPSTVTGDTIVVFLTGGGN